MGTGSSSGFYSSSGSRPTGGLTSMMPSAMSGMNSTMGMGMGMGSGLGAMGSGANDYQQLLFNQQQARVRIDKNIPLTRFHEHRLQHVWSSISSQLARTSYAVMFLSDASIHGAFDALVLCQPLLWHHTVTHIDYDIHDEFVRTLIVSAPICVLV
jgi:hypothetical protein